MRFSAAPLLAILLLQPTLAQTQGKSVALSEVADHAIRQSKLTLPGSPAFHLKVNIIETTNPSSEYKADIEEYWVTPDKWRRTIQSPDFSQTLIVNGDRVSEQNKGDYYPWWLSDLVTAVFDPLPMLDQLEKLHVQMAEPRGSEHSSSCADLKGKIERAVFCFEGSHGLLKSVFTQRGYVAEFSDFKGFKDKRIARRIVIDPEPGTTIEASITELTQLASSTDSMFAVEQPTPPEARLKFVKVDEAVARKLLLSGPEIEWPSVGNGATNGRCAVYIGVDRMGKIREVWPEGCDNSGLEDSLRDQVRKWQFKPAVENGAPVQVESLVTFEFQTAIESSKTKAMLSDPEARQLAKHVVEPKFDTGSVAAGETIKVRISVNEQGEVIGVGNPYIVPGASFLAVMNALREWTFQSYLKEGKPVIFDADIAFQGR
jgi:hypothetical protein